MARDDMRDVVLLGDEPGGVAPAAGPGLPAVRHRPVARRPADSRGEVVVLDGRLHTRSGGVVTAVDVATGRPVWRAQVPVRRSGRDLLTDGWVLLVPTTSAGGEPRPTALGLDDGRVRWSVPAPAGVEDYVAVDGRLVALTDREAVGLG